MSRSRFAELPEELITQILTFLDVRSMLRCQLVSKGFAEIINSSPILQYRMELEIAGLLDRPSVDLPISEKLQRLHAYQARLKNTTDDTYNPEAYETSSGPTGYFGDIIISLEDSDGSNESDVEDGQRPSYDAVKVGHVNPTADKEPSVVWWNFHLSHRITTFGVDLGENSLLGYLYEQAIDESRELKPVQILSLSTGSSLLEGEFLQVPVPEAGLKWRLCHSYPNGGVIAFHFLSETHLLFGITIMAWKDEVVTARMKIPLQQCNQFTWLTETRFLVGNTEESTPGVRLYSIDPRDCQRDEFGILTPAHLATFRLPEVASTDTELRFSISDASVHGTFIGPSSLSSSPPFQISPSARVCEIYCWFFVIGDQTASTDVAIYANFEAFQLQNESSHSLLSEPLTVHWDDWGKRYARCFSTYDLRTRINSRRQHGSRALTIHRILDFNSLDITRDTHLEKMKGEELYHGHIVGRDVPSVLSAGKVFKEDVVSCLPYRLRFGL